MTTASQPAFPPAAVQWLTGEEAGRWRLLALGRASAPLAGSVPVKLGQLVAVDPSRAGIRVLQARCPQLVPVVARPERLPFAPTSFGVAFVHQSLHSLDLPAVLPEIARVLRPGGHLAVSYTVRDDSVPWVRRLAALMQSVDPTAMAGDYGTEVLDVVVDSPYFPQVEQRRHRLWAPISRVDMLTMVANRFPDLPDDRLSDLLGEVGRLYESSARVPEPLLLPYQVVCWRARVDHTEFTSQLELPDDGLAIRL